MTVSLTLPPNPRPPQGVRSAPRSWPVRQTAQATGTGVYRRGPRPLRVGTATVTARIPFEVRAGRCPPLGVVRKGPAPCSAPEAQLRLGHTTKRAGSARQILDFKFTFAVPIGCLNPRSRMPAGRPRAQGRTAVAEPRNRSAHRTHLTEGRHGRGPTGAGSLFGHPLPARGRTLPRRRHGRPDQNPVTGRGSREPGGHKTASRLSSRNQYHHPEPAGVPQGHPRHPERRPGIGARGGRDRRPGRPFYRRSCHPPSAGTEQGPGL